jgi:hypothetical protein
VTSAVVSLVTVSPRSCGTEGHAGEIATGHVDACERCLGFDPQGRRSARVRARRGEQAAGGTVVKKVLVPRVVTAVQASEMALPAEIREALGELVGAASGLLALSVGAGLGSCTS